MRTRSVSVTRPSRRRAAGWWSIMGYATLRLEVSTAWVWRSSTWTHRRPASSAAMNGSWAPSLIMNAWVTWATLFFHAVMLSSRMETHCGYITAERIIVLRWQPPGSAPFWIGWRHTDGIMSRAG